MATFVQRLTKPEKGNKFYNTIGNGGWSNAIVGKPIDPDCNVLSNCVGYAFGRFNEIAYSILGESGVKALFTEGGLTDIKVNSKMMLLQPLNAENFYDVAVKQGLTISQSPSIGAIMCWQKGSTRQSTDGAGHVAVVESVVSPTCVRTSESGYNCTNPFWTQTRYQGSNSNWGQNTNYKFLGFIVNPATKSADPYPVPNRVLKEGDNGEDVKWLQWKLKNLGYLNDSIDGWFGVYTLGALLVFQLKGNLDVDGICGPATKRVLERT